MGLPSGVVNCEMRQSFAEARDITTTSGNFEIYENIIVHMIPEVSSPTHNQSLILTQTDMGADIGTAVDIWNIITLIYS